MWAVGNRGRCDRSKLRHLTDLTDAEWVLVEPLIPPARRGGNKRTVDMRAVVDGLMHILGTGCQWAAIPRDLAPRSTVHDYFARWNWDGSLGRVHHALYVRCREQVGREASPTAGIVTRRRVPDIDSPSVRSAEKGGVRTDMATMQARRPGAGSGTSWSTRKVC